MAINDDLTILMHHDGFMHCSSHLFNKRFNFLHFFGNLSHTLSQLISAEYDKHSTHKIFKFYCTKLRVLSARCYQHIFKLSEQTATHSVSSLQLIPKSLVDYLVK